MINENDDYYCYYSDLPSPMSYAFEEKTINNRSSLSVQDIDRIIEMAWEDRTPFDAIEVQFGLKEAEVKSLMKQQLRLGSYKTWRQRVENCKTKHAKKRTNGINRFKCSRQRTISQNKISKR